MELRPAKINEFDAIYRMGYEVWAEGASVEHYLDDCRNSENYKIGSWYVLVHQDNLLASLIVYSSAFGLPSGYCGIGSIATSQNQRNKGYASQLVTKMCARLQAEGVKGVYLHSDIEASFYERLGFFAVSRSTATCMVRPFSSVIPLPDSIPAYF